MNIAGYYDQLIWNRSNGVVFVWTGDYGKHPTNEHYYPIAGNGFTGDPVCRMVSRETVNMLMLTWEELARDIWDIEQH